MRTIRFASIFALVGFGLALAAVADAASQEGQRSAAGARATTPSTGEGDIPSMGRRVNAETLSRLSGGTEVSQQMTLRGTVDHNVNEHVWTGSNWIGGDSFAGAAGVPMVIQNTGNSVLIQNATILDVQFRP